MKGCGEEITVRGGWRQPLYLTLSSYWSGKLYLIRGKSENIGDFWKLIASSFCLVQIRGSLRVILRPLIPAAPLVGGVSVFFLNRPVSCSYTVRVQQIQIRDSCYSFLKLKRKWNCENGIHVFLIRLLKACVTLSRDKRLWWRSKLAEFISKQPTWLLQVLS